MADITAKTPIPTPAPIQSAPPPSEPARADYLSDLAEAAASGDTARYEELVKEHQAETQELQRQADEAGDAPIREPEPSPAPDTNLDIVGAIPSDSQLIVKNRTTGILHRVDAPPEQVREVARFVQETDMSPADVAREQTARWEQSVLPTLPQPYQKAYKDRDAAEMDRLATQYRSAREAQFTPQELKEMQSGQYKIYDYASGGFVNVSKKAYEEREAVYERIPEAGSRPGKIPLPQAVAERQLAWEQRVLPLLPDNIQADYLSGNVQSVTNYIEHQTDLHNRQQTILQELRGEGYATEVGKLSPGEYGPEVPDDLRWNYNLMGAVEAGYDQSKLRVAFGDDAIDKVVATVNALGKLDRAGGSPTWALINNMVTPDEVELIYGDGADVFLAAKSDWDKAQQTKGSADWYDLPARTMATLTTVQYLTSGSSEYLGTKYIAPLRVMANRLVDSMPDKSVWEAIRQGNTKTLIPYVSAKFATGVISAVAGKTALFSFVVGIPTNLDNPDYIDNFKGQIAKSFLDMGKKFLAEPVGGSAEVAGLILGPEGTYKLVRALVAKASPWYVPNTGIRYTFTTGKLSTKTGDIGDAIKAGKLTEVQVANAIARATNRAMQNPTATATARLGNTNIRVHIEPTPASAHMGGALWRASTTKDPYKGMEHVVDVKGHEPAEFYSLQAAPRFALRSASGADATSPALVMVYTKAGQLRAYPTSIQYASSLSEMKSSGFNYLGSGKATPGAYGPIKTYGDRFELESMLPNGMKIYRITNLHSRIFGASAGEFVTTVDGWVMPIYRFAEEGAVVPHVGIGELAAIRIASITHGLQAMLGKKGFVSEAGYATVSALTRELNAVGELATSGLVGAAAQEAYERAIDKEMVARLNAVYQQFNPTQLEQVWRSDPTRFEDAYLESVARLQAVATDYQIEDATLRPDSSYTTVRVDYDREALVERAKEFDKELTRVVTNRDPIRVDRVGSLGTGMMRGRTTRDLQRTTTAMRADRPSRVDLIRPPDMTRIARVDRPLRSDRITERIERPDSRHLTERVERPDRGDVEQIERQDRIDRTERSATPRIERTDTGADVSGENTRIPEGSIAYKKGLFWKWIPPEDFRNGVKPRTLPRGISPIGADLSGGNSPYTTIQRIGKSEAIVPERISVDEGVADAFITGGGTKIAYSGKGRQTDVGSRDPSTTMGMTVNGDGEVKGHAYARQVYPKSSVSRTDMDTDVQTPTREIRGVDRTAITERTNEMPIEPVETEPVEEDTDAFDYAALDELGALGAFADEDTNWLNSQKTVSRPRMKRSRPRRGHDSPPPTVIRRVRL